MVKFTTITGYLSDVHQVKRVYFVDNALTNCHYFRNNIELVLIQCNRRLSVYNEMFVTLEGEIEDYMDSIRKMELQKYLLKNYQVWFWCLV